MQKQWPESSVACSEQQLSPAEHFLPQAVFASASGHEAGLSLQLAELLWCQIAPARANMS